MIDWLVFIAGGITGMVATIAALAMFVDFDDDDTPPDDTESRHRHPTSRPPTAADDDDITIVGDWGHPLAYMPDDWDGHGTP